MKPKDSIRWYVRDGRIYAIRDRWVGLRNVVVEYAVPNGVEIEWKPTAEGVLFEDIAPVGRIDA